MQFKWLAALGTLLLSAPGTFAAADADAGRAHFATCVACHGENAEGNQALGAPRINHLAPVYIIAQLQKFRSGIRGGDGATASAQQMASIAATLADEKAVMDVAAYVSTLDSEAPAPGIEGDSAMGADYYNQFCGACHGPGAVGNPALQSPRLAGANDWYLLAQLQAFRSGQRGDHPDDTTGRQMRAMAAVLPGEQAVKDVVAYLSGLEQ